MKLAEFMLIVETVEDTQDILKISRDILDFVYLNKNQIVAGTTIDASRIPGLTAKTPAGQTLINATRIKIVDPQVWKKQGSNYNNVGGDAAPYYTTSQGNYGGRAYDDARMSRDVNQGRYPTLDLKTNPEFKDLISSQAAKGNKLDIRLNIELMDFDKPGNLEKATSTLSHELSHHIDTIKGRNTVADYDNTSAAKQTQDKLDLHNRIKKSWGAPGSHPGWPDPDGLLDPAEEKRLIGIVKKAPKTVPEPGTEAYWKDASEINARLVQASENLADMVKGFKVWDNNTVNETIKYFLVQNRIVNCFVNFASDAEFKASLGGQLTNAEIKQAYENPEFKKLYNRIYKFMEAEMQPGGVIAQAQKDGFKNWATASTNLAGKTPKATFIERFVQQVVKGVEAIKDVGKLALRYNHIADQALERLLAKMLPEMLMKGAFKSIPFVGLLIGVAFGIDRLIQGDVPGAGLEVVAGVGSLATAIPATAYQAARDLYGEYYMYEDTGKPAVFEYDMANDPTGTEQRVKELAAKIAEQMKAGLTQNQSRLTKAQAAANQRSAIRNVDTPANPSPYLHPELYPQQESLERILKLANL